MEITLKYSPNLHHQKLDYAVKKAIEKNLCGKCGGIIVKNHLTAMMTFHVPACKCKLV